jgi:hypothetical protein
MVVGHTAMEGRYYIPAYYNCGELTASLRPKPILVVRLPICLKVDGRHPIYPCVLE